MRTAIYCRFSSDLQNPTSLADQERVCRAYAERMGWSVAKVYCDAAISGASRERPGYQTLLADARNRAFEVVLAEDMDRLNRHLESTANLYNQLQFIGIEIHTLNHGRITDIHVGISGLLGEIYLKNLGSPLSHVGSLRSSLPAIR